MADGPEQGHAPADPARAAANARLYGQQRAMLRAGAGWFRSRGLELVDCSPGRPLDGAWPWATPGEAVAMCLAGHPAAPCDYKALPHGEDAWRAARLCEGEWAL